MTLPPEDRDLIERVLGVSAFNAPHTMYSFEDVEALLAAVRAEAAPSSPGDGWELNNELGSMQDDLDLLGGFVLHLEDGKPITVGNPTALAAVLRRVLTSAYPPLPAAPSPGGDQ